MNAMISDGKEISCPLSACSPRWTAFQCRPGVQRRRPAWFAPPQFAWALARHYPGRGHSAAIRTHHPNLTTRPVRLPLAFRCSAETSSDTILGRLGQQRLRRHRDRSPGTRSVLAGRRIRQQIRIFADSSDPHCPSECSSRPPTGRRWPGLAGRRPGVQHPQRSPDRAGWTSCSAAAGDWAPVVSHGGVSGSSEDLC
jgi:hypothetical protein